ncbi:SANT/Myb_domain [Hexamita inflata]|uniref:SANT/Myb domain n=1 Tax=Hexamita inflata TaxID=28002 RepID=A0AA86VK65_9EUKA|nr:SANT/Myb domain [Hexamita inflata]
MYSDLIILTLKDNLEQLNQIHQVHHQIQQLQQLQLPDCSQQRDRWTRQEDELLSHAVKAIGKQNYAKLSKFIASKSSKQVYFRLRYLSQKKRQDDIWI